MDKAIFLCGFMGAGKSSVGRALARALKCPLLDTDRLIEEAHGPIPKIFEEKGEAHFRQLEAQLAQKLREEENVVISTGGGFVLSEAVQEALKGCQVVYLDVPFEITSDKDKILNAETMKEELEKRLFNEVRNILLSEVDKIYAEDTRNSGVLLKHYNLFHLAYYQLYLQL